MSVGHEELQRNLPAVLQRLGLHRRSDLSERVVRVPLRDQRLQRDLPTVLRQLGLQRRQDLSKRSVLVPLWATGLQRDLPAVLHQLGLQQPAQHQVLQRHVLPELGLLTRLSA